MLLLQVVNVYRKSNNKIYGYRLQDSNGNIKDVTSDELKQLLKSNKVKLLNYKLTSDNRIIPSMQNNNTEYLLMNKDTRVLRFDIDFGLIC